MKRNGKRPRLTAGQQRLVEQFLPMAHKFVGDNLGNPDVGADPDEAFSFACVILCKAVRNWDKRKASLSTYIWHALEREFRRYRSKTLVKTPTHPVTDPPLISPCDPAELAGVESPREPSDTEANNRSVARLIALLPAREAEAVSRVYGVRGYPSGLDLDDIAAEMGIKRAMLYRLIRQGRNRLRAIVGNATDERGKRPPAVGKAA